MVGAVGSNPAVPTNNSLKKTSFDVFFLVISHKYAD
jgi:hypothetical protein